MPLPEGYRPRKGDVLIAHVTAYTDVDPEDTQVWATLPGKPHSRHFIDLEDIAGVYSRHFEPGEKVRSVGDFTGQAGEVVAVHEGFVWIKDGHGQMQTIAANELEAVVDPVDRSFVEPAPQAPPYDSPAKAYLVQEPEPMDQEKLDRIG